MRNVYIVQHSYDYDIEIECNDIVFIADTLDEAMRGLKEAKSRIKLECPRNEWWIIEEYKHGVVCDNSRREIYTEEIVHMGEVCTRKLRINNSINT